MSINQPDATLLHLPLSKREKVILSLAAAGHGYKNIANTLGLALGTIRNHLLRVRRKLNATNTTHAVALAIRQGIIQ